MGTTQKTPVWVILDQPMFQSRDHRPIYPSSKIIEIQVNLSMATPKMRQRQALYHEGQTVAQFIDAGGTLKGFQKDLRDGAVALGLPDLVPCYSEAPRKSAGNYCPAKPICMVECVLI